MIDKLNTIVSMITALVMVAALAILAACSTAPNDLDTLTTDPYEATNRKIFGFNLRADSAILEPVANAYRNNVPAFGQQAIANHVNWLGMPSIAINSTLQGEFDNAGLAVVNFVFNGLTLGLFDIIDEADKPRHEDFGQTLAAADVAPGDYIVLPFFGSTTTRGATGKVVDFILNPLSVIQTNSTGEAIKTARIPATAVSFRAQNFDAINQLKYESPDPYAGARGIYIQQRSALLRDHVVEEGHSSTSDDEFDFFFE